MKRLLIALVCVAVCAACVFAVSVSKKLLVEGANTPSQGHLLVFDSARSEGDSTVVDTLYSDTIDVSDAKRVSVYYNLGTVVPATHGNDSVKIYYAIQIKGLQSHQWNTWLVDTMGGNAITGLDDSTKLRSINTDSIATNLLRIRTIIGERCTSTIDAAAEAETTIVPIYFDVIKRLE